MAWRCIVPTWKSQGRFIEKERRRGRGGKSLFRCSVLVWPDKREIHLLFIKSLDAPEGKEGGIKGFGEQSRARLDNYEVSEFTTPDYCL